MAKKAKRQHVVKRSDRVDPTPETAAKLLPDNLAFLRHEYQRAAGEIEAAYRIAVALVAGKISKPDTVGGGKHAMTDREAEQVRIYTLWLKELERRKIPHYPLLNVIVDNVPAWAVDQRKRWQPGTTAEFMIEALDMYCRLDKSPLRV